MAPILQVFRIGEAGVDSGVTWPLSDDRNVSVVDELTVSSIPPDTDCLIVYWERGQTRVPATGGTSMSVVTTAAKSQAEAFEWGTKALAHLAVPDEYSLTVFPTGDGDIPGIDCLPGDTVHFADGLGSALSERLTGWKFSIVGDDQKFDVTVKSRQLVEFEALDRILNQKAVGSGTLGGQASAQTPDLPPRFAPQSITDEETFQFDLAAMPAASPATDVSQSKNFWGASVRVKAPFVNDIEFTVHVDGVEMMGGLGKLPAGWTYALIPVFPFSGVSTKWTTAYTTPLEVAVITTPAVDVDNVGGDVVIKLLFA